MNKYRAVYIFMGFFLICFVLNAQETTKWVAPNNSKSIKNPIIDPGEITFSISEGEYIYAKHCAKCHGKKGEGDGKAGKVLATKPTNLTLTVVQKQEDGELFWKITNGRNLMPRFEKILDEGDRWFLVNYIRSLSK